MNLSSTPRDAAQDVLRHAQPLDAFFKPRSVDLSVDHHHALVQAHRLQHASHADDAERQNAVAAFLEFWRADGQHHFCENGSANMSANQRKVMIQINLNQKAIGKIENDFDNPLGLLSDCHRRIENFLEQIIRVCETARGGALNDAQREALQVALRYFRQAAPLHTQDEENSLFPRLRERAEAGDVAAQSALQVIERLEADHDAADSSHAVIDELGLRWLENNELNGADAAQLENESRQLRAFYAAHIAVEDNELFPLAEKVLAGDTTETIGREMAARRGLNFDHLPAGSRCAARKAALAATE